MALPSVFGERKAHSALFRTVINTALILQQFIKKTAATQCVPWLTLELLQMNALASKD